MKLGTIGVFCLLIANDATSMTQSDAAVASAKQASPLKFAIASFYGFYFNSVRFNPDYCKTLGVDLAPFIKAFKTINQDAYSVAVKALRVESKGSQDEESLYQKMAPTLSSMARTQWDGVAAKNSVTPTKLCQNVAENPDLFASTQVYSDHHSEELKTLQAAAAGR